MTAVRPALAFSAVVLRSMVRDRTALFFMLVLPVVVITVVGSTFGGPSRVDVGIVVDDAGPVGTRMAAALEAADGIALQHFDDVETLERAVRRARASGGLVVPSGASAAVESRTPVQLGWVAGPPEVGGFATRLAVEAIVDEQAARLGAAAFVVDATGGELEAAVSLADRVADSGAGLDVEIEDVGDGRVRDLSSFSLVASQQLVLFVFINSLTAAMLIVRARRDGVLRRALATPTSVTTQLVGLGLGWFVLALLQSVIIVAVGWLLFDVPWGDPVGATALVVAWALVGCGAGLLVGAIGRDEDRVGAIAPIVGIVLGALGGCMVPLEVFPEQLRDAARAIPHYWAVTGWRALVFDGVGIGGIAGSLTVLLVVAAVLVAGASALLRRQMVD